MRILLTLVALLGAVLASAWVVVDHRLTEWVRTGFEQAGADGHMQLRRASLAPPDRVVLRDTVLSDPVTGRAIAGFDEVELLFSLTWDGDRPVPELSEVRGHGGRVLLYADDEGLVLVRVIEHLVQLIDNLADPDAEERPRSEPLPRIVGDDVTLVFGAPGRVNRVVDHAWFSVGGTGDNVRVDAQIGPHGGWFATNIGRQGLLTVDVSDAAIDPTVLDIADAIGRELAHEYRPTGRLDLHVDLDPLTGKASARGELRDGTLFPDHVPFPLEEVHLPFVWEDGQLRVEEATLRVADGDVVVTLEDGPDAHRALISTRETGFRSELLDLIPGRETMHWLKCDDGGRLELFLDVRVDEVTEQADVTGWGGFYIESMSLGERDLPLRDVVGRFEVEPGELRFFNATARLAQGTLGFRGAFGLDDDHFDIELWGTELELRDVVPAFTAAGFDETEGVVAGWLDGEVAIAGFPGDRRGWTGNGRLAVHGGQLWDLPFFESTLQALSPGKAPSQESDRQRLDVEFEIGNARVTVPSGGLRLQSALLSYSGEGYVSKHGGLHLQLHALDNAVWKIVQENLLLDVEVDGTLAEPVVKIRPLKVVTGPLSGLFGWIPDLFKSSEEVASDEPGSEEP